MRLFFFPDACSLAAHIALRETRQDFELVPVEYGTKRFEDGSDYRAVNPKGSVPALELGNGQVLTEVAVILQFIVAQAPKCALVPGDRDLARWRCLEWLNYIATELHKSVSPLYRASTPENFRQPGLDHLTERFTHVETVLSRQRFLCGEQYSVADTYLYVICRWLPALQIETARWPAVRDHYSRVAGRTAVQAALTAEGLVDTGFVNGGDVGVNSDPC